LSDADPSPTGRVIRDLDIYRTANLLIEQHGSEAVPDAERLLGLMLDRGDMEDLQVWLRVRDTIMQLQAAQTSPAH